MPVWLLVALMAALVGGLWTTAIGGFEIWPAPLLLPWPVLALLFFAAERFVIDLEVREQTHSFSLSEIALVLGLVFATPFDLLFGQAVGAGVALLLRPGQRPVKLAFNLANFALGTSAALIVYHLVLGVAEPLSPVGWLAAIAAGLACDLTTGSSVAAVIWVTQRERPRFESLFGFGTAYMLVAVSLGLLAATVLWHAPAAIWLLAVLVTMAYVAIRIHGRELVRQQSLIRLHESTRRIQQSFSFDEVSRSLLDTAREMFEGELAEMLIFPEQGDEGRLLRTSEEGVGKWTRYRLDPTEGVWARVSAEGRGLIMRPPDGAASGAGLRRRLGRRVPADTGMPERVLAHFAARGVRSAMVAPLRVEEASVGTLLVGNRRGSVSSWSDDDLTLLETLANHASVALQNSRQADELARQRDELERSATHDGLTGLPNRVLFQARLRDALAQRSGEVAVLVMDLDRFKEVNDTLGHHNGDALLRDVAERLVAAAGESVMVSRLGGDEFAVLLTQADVNTCVATADQLLAGLRPPFLVLGVTVPVEASIGICLGPAHGEDPETLLRRAEVAMYRAKAQRSRYAIYEAQHDPYSEARLALFGELARAISERELTVAYQPQAAAGTGELVGFEALLRWHHPQRGDLPPDEFIPLAEQSELIHQLTRLVLDEAIRACAGWRAGGHDVQVSVNLSARNLSDLSLADDVLRMLAEAGLPPAALVLEITETAIESNALHSAEVLGRLKDIGVRLAIDDFGAGYSSFGYLARLPVDEIKIDRSFVLGMQDDERRLAIVRSTIQLGHNLGLRVVAEGVETEAIRRRLARLGCDLVQGYHIGRAVSLDMATARLRRPARVERPAARLRRAG
ncbi:MAG TPA: GGDEF domain-containing protein [Candidatus Limnocylindrales bacterium]|nr:GGDEF domain-containing protein [Candidatus Limnocylindrales bacterium]